MLVRVHEYGRRAAERIDCTRRGWRACCCARWARRRVSSIYTINERPFSTCAGRCASRRVLCCDYFLYIRQRPHLVIVFDEFSLNATQRAGRVAQECTTPEKEPAENDPDMALGRD